MPDLRWTVRGSAAAVRAVRPLIDAHARVRSVVVEEVAEAEVVEFEGGGMTGRVPADPRLGRFAESAAAVCRREGPTGPVALLAQWDERAHHGAEEASRLAPAPLLWPARVMTGRDLPSALGIGLGACVYFGHGHCGGWDGYWGIDARTLAGAMTEPVGAVFSLTCMAAKRPTMGFSFCEELVLSGYCAAAWGSAGRTSHRRNRRLGSELCRAMRDHGTAAAVLRNSQATRLSMLGYRLVGDPLACLSGSPAASARAAAIEENFWRPA
ncbi:MAG: hypothetical protein JWP63_5835 [Candidatus Solibacter sp.]|jgi:hypothetical protein|nr:hypothetical protein [Candidatus Solibacter sp.]